MRDDSWVHTIRSSDLIIIQIQRTEFTDPNQYFYQYGSQTFSESLKSGHAEILSVFPMPIWNFELNIFMTICIKVLTILKGDDLLVLRVVETQGSKSLRGRIPFVVNILVCAVSHLLLL